MNIAHEPVPFKASSLISRLAVGLCAGKWTARSNLQHVTLDTGVPRRMNEPGEQL
jgi:hypothetical protein